MDVKRVEARAPDVSTGFDDPTGSWIPIPAAAALVSFKRVVGAFLLPLKGTTLAHGAGKRKVAVSLSKTPSPSPAPGELAVCPAIGCVNVRMNG